MMNIKISKKFLIIISLLLVAFIICYTLAFSALVKRKLDNLKKELSAANSAEKDAKIGFITNIKQDSEFTLLEYDGKIGVYDSDSYELLEILDVYVVTLPDADKKMLEGGIGAESAKELVSLIEDYTS